MIIYGVEGEGLQGGRVLVEVGFPFFQRSENWREGPRYLLESNFAP